MATPLSLFALLTFLLVGTPYCSSRDIPASGISLVQEPEENYYIGKKKPAVIVCQALNAEDIIFTCMGTQIPPSSVEMEDVSEISPNLIQAKIEVTRADVNNYDSSGSKFWCECSALDIDSQVAVTSRRSYVTIATLKYKFGMDPMSTTAREGENVEFACVAPEGDPQPEIIWRKDQKRLDIDGNSRLLVTDMGSLVIESATQEDAGTYQCIAKNLAGRRESEEAVLTVNALAESAEPAVEISGQSKPRTTRQSESAFFTTELEDVYYITRNEPLKIDCGINGAEILTFRCNDQRMDRERITTNTGKDQSGKVAIQSQLQLTYSDVEQHEQQYGGRRPFQCQCVAWYQDRSSESGWGSILSSSDVGKVLLAKLDDQFKKEPSSVTIGVGQEATMMCEPPEGQPSPWVYWYKDSTRLDPRNDEKYSITARGHLTIHNVQFEDEGYYSCMAENTAKTVRSRQGRLTVTREPQTRPQTTTPATTGAGEFVPEFPDVIPSSPVFLRDFETENTLGADGTKTMLCAVVSAEQMTVECGGQRLRPGAYTLETKVDDRSGERLLYATAVITSEQVQTVPDFFCQCTAWYLNERDGWEQLTSNRGYIFESEQVDDVYIDEDFYYGPEDIEFAYGDSAELPCKAPNGNPVPTVYWLKDGERINPEADSNFLILEDGPLIIEFVRAEDEGMYTCVAENEAGTRASNPAQLSVYDKPATQPETPPTTAAPVVGRTTTEYYDYELNEPLFVVDPAPRSYIVKDEQVTLTCQVASVTTVLFVCNDNVLPETAQTERTYEDDVYQQRIHVNTLTVTREQVEAYRGSGPYTCKCRAYYQKDGAAYLERSEVDGPDATIEIAYLRNRFMKEPTDTQASYLGTVTLPCEAPNGVPKPDIYWQKDGERVMENERIRVEESGSLVIDSFDEEDEGFYSCVAENMAKQRTSAEAYVTLSEVDPGVVEPETKPEAESKPEPETTDPEPTDSAPVTYPAGTPYISKDLHSVYYLIKNKPVTITCEARDVHSITFECGNEEVEVKETLERVDELVTETGEIALVQVVEASIDVSKSDLERFVAANDFFCQCFAHYTVPGTGEADILSSGRGFVESAYLKKNFQKEPENKRVNEGQFLSINCQPPVGNPEPKVSWTKDGVAVEALSITPDGALIFPEIRVEHAGQYVCIAENEAGSRNSPPILLEVVAVEGGVAEGGVAEGGKDTDGGEEGSEPEGEAEGVTTVPEVTPEDEVVSEEVEDVTPEGETGSVPEGESEVDGGMSTGEPDDNVWHVSEVDDGYAYGETNDYEGGTTEPSAEGNTFDNEGGQNNAIVCTEMLTSCTGHIQQNVDDNSYCQAVPGYIACLDNFFKICTGVVNEATLGAVRMSYMHAQERCTRQANNCPKLDECKMIYSNSPDMSMDTMGLPVTDFCDDVNTFLRCVDQTLADCNVTMAPPEDDVRTSLIDVAGWFDQYCSRMIVGSDALVGCEQMNSCELRIGDVAPNNATYWCRLMSSLVECTATAVNTCMLDELRNDLEDLHAQANAQSCSDDMGVPEAEGKPEPEGESVAEGATGERDHDEDDDDDEDEDDDDDDEEEMENMGGDVEASKTPENGASVLGTSVLLATILQLLVAAILSRR